MQRSVPRFPYPVLNIGHLQHCHRGLARCEIPALEHTLHIDPLAARGLLFEHSLHRAVTFDDRGNKTGGCYAAVTRLRVRKRAEWQQRDPGAGIPRRPSLEAAQLSLLNLQPSWDRQH